MSARPSADTLRNSPAPEHPPPISCAPTELSYLLYIIITQPEFTALCGHLNLFEPYPKSTRFQY